MVLDRWVGTSLERDCLHFFKPSLIIFSLDRLLTFYYYSSWNIISLGRYSRQSHILPIVGFPWTDSLHSHILPIVWFPWTDSLHSHILPLVWFPWTDS